VQQIISEILVVPAANACGPARARNGWLTS
jgi:hypothetical protein